MAHTPRNRPAALQGLPSSFEDNESDFLCPVCFHCIREAYVTRCGHTFCHSCIARSIEIHRRCPKCGASLATLDAIFPNFLMNEVIAKHRLRIEAGSPSNDGPSMSEGLRSFVAAESKNLSMPDVDVMLEILTRRKRLLEAESCASQNRLLYDFLSQLHKVKTQQKIQLERELRLVQRDMDEVEGVLRDVRKRRPTLADLPPPGSEPGAAELRQEMADLINSIDATARQPEPDEETLASSEVEVGDAIAARRKRMHAHFEDFVRCYFARRADDLYFGSDENDADRVPQASEASDGGDSASNVTARVPQMEGRRGLDAFRDDLVKFSKFRALRPIATLSYSSDALNFSTIVSTIDFDKDDEFFAIAGVTKRIKVFEYGAVARDAVDVHYPCAEMASSHKVSCVSWNAYHKNVLASSDYEGAVVVWDAATGQCTKAYREHDKRAWSVHFNQADVRLLASGSDDSRVKLWSLNSEHSVATLEAKFNVCCVRFNPKSSCHLAFGSADHCVHYYDLRSPRKPLRVFRDHRKAVSYVKFLDAETLVSASTDSQLKLWRVDSARCVRSFVGHANEKNFVGLATDGEYVACGSENNSLYVYYSGLSRPLLSYNFETVKGFLGDKNTPGTSGDNTRGNGGTDDHGEFVSAVCFRRNSNVIVAANSQGTIKVLELV